MNIIKLRANLTLTNHVIKEYEFEWGPLRLIRQYRFPYNSIMKLTQYFTTKSQLHFSTLSNYIETRVAYYPL